MNSIQASGIEPGQRHLNGPQTTGRNYRNLSQPQYAIVQDNDVAVPMHDGVNLLADVLRPSEVGRYPVLVAASPYPRQIQNTGAPLGIVDAGTCTTWSNRPPRSLGRMAMSAWWASAISR